MFKQLTLAATIAATTTFAAPGAQAFGFKDALGIANTVINTVEVIENEINGERPAPQVQQPQVQQPAPQYETAAPVASNALCAPDALGQQIYGIIPTIGASVGCNQAQINAAIEYNKGLQHECNMRGFDKYQGGKCMMY